MNHKNETSLVHARLTLLLVAAAWLIPARAADFSFNPEITVAGIYSDNLLLAPAGQEESETIGEVRPGLRMALRGRRAEGTLEYQMENYFFSGNSDRDQTYHELDGTLESELISQLLYFDATARMSQAIIDPEQLVPYSNFVTTENRADYTAVEVDPYLERDFGNVVRVRLGYSYGIVRFDDFDEQVAANLQDLDDRVINVVVASLPEDRTLSWELRYNDERVEFDTAARVEYEVAGAELGWRVTPSLQLLGRAGRESDLRENQVTTEVESDIWAAGFRWRPSARNELEATFGERFFGETYTANWSFEGSRLVAGFDYSESPLIVGQQLFQLPVLTDPLPGDTGASLTAITPEVYLSELASAWIGLVGRRNTVQVTLYRDAREFLSTNEDEDEEGALLDWDWRLGPRTTMFSEITWQRIGYRGSERNDEFLQAALGAERQLGQATWLLLDVRHGRRTSDATPVSPLYKENGAMLQLRHRFGRPPPEDVDAPRSRADRGRRGESLMRGR